MIILRQKEYSVGSKVAYLKNKAGQKFEELTQDVNHAIRRSMTTNDSDRRVMDAEHNRYMRQLINKNKESEPQVKRKSVMEKQSLNDRINKVVTDISTNSPGTTISKVAQFVADHPLVIGAPLVPVPGATEYMVLSGDKKIQEKVPVYKKIAEKTGGFYKRFLRKPIQGAIDATIEHIKHF